MKRKNELSRSVSNVNKRLDRYGGVLYKDNKKINIAYSKEKTTLKVQYNEYKKMLKEYNKGNIDENGLKLAQQRVEETLENYKNRFNKSNRQELLEERAKSEKVLNSRIGSTKNIMDFNDVESRYKEISDIINNAIDKKNLKENSELEHLTAQEIYDRIYGNAIETPYYELRSDMIAEDRTQFRQSILKNLKNGGYLDDVEIGKINNLLSI